MKAFDRAIVAVFLLALLADAAWAHASVPAAGDAGLFLSAASQLQVGSGENAMPVFRRTAPSPQRSPAFGRFTLKISGWSGRLLHLSNASDFASPLLRIDAPPDAGARFTALASIESSAAFQPFFRHTGSPAP